MLLTHEFSEGIQSGGDASWPVVLKDGQPMNTSEIVELLERFSDVADALAEAESSLTWALTKAGIQEEFVRNPRRYSALYNARVALASVGRWKGAMREETDSENIARSIAEKRFPERLPKVMRPVGEESL